MDGINCEAACDIDTVDLNDCKFIELKVKLLQSEKQKRNFLRYTLRNWWCQCFLANIKEIVVGYRDEDGIVRDLSTIQVPDIPNQVNVSEYFYRQFRFRPVINKICFFFSEYMVTSCLYGILRYIFEVCCKRNERYQ